MTEKVFNALQVLILTAILLSALFLQLVMGEEPCPLCLLQRLFMMGVGTAICLNLRSGIRKQHYGLAIVAALMGSVVSLRQIAFHICPGFPKFGEPFWGISLYTWAFFTFAASILYNALMMIIFRQEKEHRMTWLDHTTFALFFLAIAINIVTAFMNCGFGPCHDVPF